MEKAKTQKIEIAGYRVDSSGLTHVRIRHIGGPEYGKKVYGGTDSSLPKAFERAVNSLLARLAELSDETPDQRAERLLGKWLVENQGCSYAHDPRTQSFWIFDDSAELFGAYAADVRRHEGYGPTKAEAILDALRKAGCKDV